MELFIVFLFCFALDWIRSTTHFLMGQTRLKHPSRYCFDNSLVTSLMLRVYMCRNVQYMCRLRPTSKKKHFARIRMNNSYNNHSCPVTSNNLDTESTKSYKKQTLIFIDYRNDPNLLQSKINFYNWLPLNPITPIFPICRSLISASLILWLIYCAVPNQITTVHGGGSVTVYK